MAGMSSHQSRGRGEKVWLTPPELIKALGPFDLDPCFSEPRPWDTALQHYGPEAAGGLGGLFAEWHGFVWCNPPYDQELGKWLSRCADHGNALALIFARTETGAFHSEVWQRADAVFFFAGRIVFRHPNGGRARSGGGAPSCLVMYGETAVLRVLAAGLLGRFVSLTDLARRLEDKRWLQVQSK
ncbi:DNA N-6-adenine-methyltransferase [Martelella sp. FOR1707]